MQVWLQSDLLFSGVQLTNLHSVHQEHIKALPMTTAHGLVITHHDFETYPSWVSSLPYFHFLETEFRHSRIFNVPASIAGSSILVHSKCCLLETLQVRSTRTNEGVETHCNSTASGSSHHCRDLASLKLMLRLHNVQIRSWKISAITTQPWTQIFVSKSHFSNRSGVPRET